MRTKTYNQIKKDELLQAIGKMVDAELLRRAVITAVFTKNSVDEWSYLIGKCEFSDNFEDIKEIYSGVAFIKKSISDFDLEDFLIFHHKV